MDILGFEKLLFHPDKLVNLRAGDPQFPTNVTVSLGNFCNHGCLWCTAYASQQEDVRHMDQARLTGFLTRARDYGLQAVAYIGNGEPTAYPGFGELTAAVSALGLEQGMFTNGYLLDRHVGALLDCFTYVRVSLDAGSTTMHDAMHDVSGHFPKIMENIKELACKRKDALPTIGVQFAVHHENFEDLFAAAGAARAAGADYFSIKPVYNRGSVGEKIEKNNLTDAQLAPKAARIKREFDGDGFSVFYRPHQIANEMADVNLLEYDRCVAGFFNIQVYEDGNVISCGPGRISVGSIDDDMAEIERNILKVSDALDLSKCPAGCRYHALNHLAASVLETDKARQFHHNFI